MECCGRLTRMSEPSSLQRRRQVAVSALSSWHQWRSQTKSPSGQAKGLQLESQVPLPGLAQVDCGTVIAAADILS